MASAYEAGSPNRAMIQGYGAPYADTAYTTFGGGVAANVYPASAPTVPATLAPSYFTGGERLLEGGAPIAFEASNLPAATVAYTAQPYAVAGSSLPPGQVVAFGGPTTMQYANPTTVQTYASPATVQTYTSPPTVQTYASPATAQTYAATSPVRVEAYAAPARMEYAAPARREVETLAAAPTQAVVAAPPAVYSGYANYGTPYGATSREPEPVRVVEDRAQEVSAVRTEAAQAQYAAQYAAHAAQVQGYAGYANQGYPGYYGQQLQGYGYPGQLQAPYPQQQGGSFLVGYPGAYQGAYPGFGYYGGGYPQGYGGDLRQRRRRGACC